MKRILFALIAAALLVGVVAAQQKTSDDVELQKAIRTETVDGNLKAAIEQYQTLSKSTDRAVAAQALLRMGECYEKLGNGEARKAYEQVVSRFAQFPDQRDVVEKARKRLTAGVAPGSVDDAIVERVVPVPLSECSNDVRVSADGRTLSFVACDKDKVGVFLYDVTTGRERLVPNTADCSSALLSRDARQVACTWGERRGAPEMRVMHVDGSAVHTVFSGRNPAYPTDWSPDGKSIVARVWNSGPMDLVLISVTDGTVRTLKSGGGVGNSNSEPRFSLDGRYLVHPAARVGANGKPTVTTIHLMTLDGGAEVPLVDGPPTEKDWNPVWTPDGKRVVFYSDRSGSSALWAQRVEAGKPQGDAELLRTSFGDDHLMGFTASSDLYCYRLQSLQDVYVAEIDAAAARVISAPVRVNQTHIGRTNGPLAWSPDGRSLAFTRTINSKPVLVIRSVDTGEERELPGAPTSIISWLPDGQSLLAGSPPKRVDIKTGQAEPVSSLARAQVLFVGTQVALSPDGKTAYYSITDDAAPANGQMKTVRLLAQRLDGSEPTVVYETTAPTLLHSIAVSPDGHYVAFGQLSHGQPVVKVVPAAGGEAREVFTRSYWGVVWSKDGRYLLARGGLSDDESGNKVQLLSIAIDGGKVRPIAVRPLFPAIALNADGRRLAFVDGTVTEKVVAIRNLLGSSASHVGK